MRRTEHAGWAIAVESVRSTAGRRPKRIVVRDDGQLPREIQIPSAMLFKSEAAADMAAISLAIRYIDAHA
jgi:hypothetical protein